MGINLSSAAGDWDTNELANLKNEEPKDPRRRNSLAYNIATYVRAEVEDNYDKILEEIRREKNEIVYRPRAATAKYTKIAEGVLQGSMKELRDQTLQSFRTINRKFKDQFINQSLIHLVCQEGYYVMLDFMIDPKNHSVFEEEELIINPKDLKGRIPLFHCFTPPTATFLGVKYGVTPEGEAVPSRPAGLNTPKDWIQPGRPVDRENCIKLLIEKGADVNARDYHKFTALHYAAMWGWELTGRRLVTAGADVNAVNINGRTALMFAVEYLHVFFVEYLLTKLPSLHLNAADAEGNTALILAILAGDKALPILKLLLEAKADTELLNSKNNSALKLACEAQNLAQVFLLFDYNVDRKESCLALLEGKALDAVNERIKEEERIAQLEYERQQLEKKLRARDGLVDLSNEDPTGKWIVLNDKRGHGLFYYNTVSRVTQKKEPLDYVPDLSRPIKDATYGLHFYHD